VKREKVEVERGRDGREKEEEDEKEGGREGERERERERARDAAAMVMWPHPAEPANELSADRRPT